VTPFGNKRGARRRDAESSSTFPPEEDVRIRPYGIEDAEDLWTAVRESVSELTPWMPWCHPEYSIDESRRWVEEQSLAFRARKEFQFVITQADGHFLGACGLNDLDAANRRANLGYWVRSRETGRGVASSAVRILRDWAFAETDLIRLEIVVAVGNLASRRVAEKVGARKEGRLQRRLWLEGRASDAILYAFTREPSQAFTAPGSR
jgi:RimJ/RimL family protein N-acetyltransferase